VTLAEPVAVAYVHHNEVAYSFHHSVLRLLLEDLGQGQQLRRGGIIAIRSSSSGLISTARNRAVSCFLEDQMAAWLWMVDTDMGFAPDTVGRLLEAADPVSRPVVGGLCLAQREVAPDGLGGYHTMPTPTIFNWITEGDLGGFEVRADYPPDEVTRCDGTGAACLLVHRGVLERMQVAWGPTWFDRIPARDGSVGEDLSFCMRARELAIPIHVHTGVRTSHLKATWLAEPAEELAEVGA
jgi:hypothetical protein